MYYYFRGYCKPYYQLMPVQYEKQSDGQYHKVGNGMYECWYMWCIFGRM